ncbi:MAG TPA: cytochrome ubiquinol oxidase subunit I [Bordetella sp.]
MDITPLLLARIQFLASFSFLALFMALALALSWILLFFKLSARLTGHAGWTAAYRFWVRVFALSFVLSLAACLPVLIQLGSIWSGLMDKIGNVAGPLLGYAVLSVFVLKSCFLGVMLFGQRRVSDTIHTLAVFMVALGMLLAVAWLVAVHSWMQTPDGAAVVDGRYQVYDWFEVIFNPSFGWSLLLTVLGAALAAAFLMMGVTALQARRRPSGDGERNAFKTALVVAVLASLLQALAAVGIGDVVSRYQPVKAATLAGYWHSGDEPELILLGWPDAQTQTNRVLVSIHGMGGRWLGRDAQGYLGLDKFTGPRPPVALSFWLLRGSALLGMLMAAVSVLTLMRTMWRRMDLAVLSAWWHKVLVGMTFSGCLSVVLGWGVSLVGLLPFVVNRSINLIDVLGPVSTGTLVYGLVGYAALYAVLIVAFLGMLLHAVRYGVVPVRKTTGGAA